MATTGNVFAGTGENNAGIGATAWTNPGTITLDNATDATCNAAASSQYLVARNFDFSSIPNDAVILGITVQAEASEHTAGTESLFAQLQNESGTLVGSSQSQNISGTAKVVYTYGGSADVWGATLTPSIVKDADFGVRFWFTSAHDVRVDFVTMAVEYSTPLPAGSSAGSNPTLRKQRGLMHIGQALLLTTLAVVASTATTRPPLVTRIPARQPSPQLLVPNLLTSTLAPVVAAPFRQSDWPNPVVRRYQQPPAYQSPLLTILASIAPVGPETVFREPYVPRAVRFKQEWPASNLLLTALSAPAVAAPFAQRQWDNPRGAKQLAPSLAAADLLLTTLAASPEPPAETVLRAPLVTRYQTRARRFDGWTQSLKLNLIGQDEYGQFVDVQSVPVRASQVALRGFSQNLLQTTLSGTPAAPFAQDDWQNPRVKKTETPFWSNDLVRVLAAVPQATPFAQSDFPNPLRLAVRLELRTWRQDLKQNLIGQDAYRPRVEFSGAPSRTFPVALRGFSQNLLQTTLATPQPAPFSQSDWPIPRAERLPAKQGSGANLLGTTLAPTAEAMPFSQADWPIRRALPRSAVGIDGVSRIAITATFDPFSQHDWPIPKGKTHAQLLRSWLQSPFGIEGERPFNESDWPVPRGRAPLVNTFLHGFNAYYDAPATDARATFDARGYDHVYFDVSWDETYFDAS